MSKPPRRYSTFLKTHKDVGKAYQMLGEAATEAGPLDKKSIALIKLGISVGMRHEGAVHAHTRKALAAGCKPDELQHAVILATTTLGFPNMMAAYTWVDDVLTDADEG
jgi:alkylhydroperoxidase/carboxymuconolactone decarboxylase family protein YurZ